MAAAGDAPKVVHADWRNAAGRVRRAYDLGSDVSLRSRSDDPKSLSRVLRDLGDWRGAYWACADTGDGWTLTVFAHTATPAPFVYRPRSSSASVWQWACRACGTIDPRWSWAEEDYADGTAPMVRYKVTLDPAEPLVAVPWACPRKGCHGAPRWQQAT